MAKHGSFDMTFLKTGVGFAESIIALDILSTQLTPLLRPLYGDIRAFLESAECDVSIQSTQCRAHCYFLALDGNKRPRLNDFVRFVAERITDFAIPRREVRRALEDAYRLGTASPIARLNEQARLLFTSLPKSGEGGEVLLSVLIEEFLQLPQLFTKMSLKTNPEMHVYGSDGIHVGVTSNGNLALYWGESKLYQDAASGIRNCFASVAPFLLDAGGGKSSQERDLQLLRDHLKLDDPILEEALKTYLDPNNARFKKLEYRAACLVGFDLAAYPLEPNSKELQQLKADVVDSFNTCKTNIANRLLLEKLHTFEIEVFCLPFPSVDEFRKSFREQLGFKNE